MTDRQARFLVTVMAHSGSFLERRYCAFAGIARGQNSRDFVAGLVARGHATAITPGSVRRGRIYHVHHTALSGHRRTQQPPPAADDLGPRH